MAHIRYNVNILRGPQIAKNYHDSDRCYVTDATHFRKNDDKKTKQCLLIMQQRETKLTKLRL